VDFADEPQAHGQGLQAFQSLDQGSAGLSAHAALSGVAGEGRVNTSGPERRDETCGNVYALAWRRCAGTAYACTGSGQDSDNRRGLTAR
jgi:hypothetical protein